jgi:hypothetical protein
VHTNRFDLVTLTFIFVTLTFMFDLFDLLFKSFNMGVAVSGICLSLGGIHVLQTHKDTYAKIAPPDPLWEVEFKNLILHYIKKLLCTDIVQIQVC